MLRSKNEWSRGDIQVFRLAIMSDKLKSFRQSKTYTISRMQATNWREECLILVLIAVACIGLLENSRYATIYADQTVELGHCPARPSTYLCFILFMVCVNYL